MYKNLFQTLQDIEKYRKDNKEMSFCLARLDTGMVYLNKREILNFLKWDIYDMFNIPQEYKAYFAGLTEYVYKLHGEEPPEWVHDKKFVLDELTFLYPHRCVIAMGGMDDYKNSLISQGVPEFMKRNLVVTIRDFLSSV
jgi:hypothetical protein